MEDGEPRERTHSQGRVHFDESQAAEHAGEIPITLSPDGKHADVHLGFLQEKHKYEIRIVVPFYLGDVIHLEQRNPNVELVSVKADIKKKKHVINAKLITSHHGLVNEELKLACPDGSHFELTISARVLGRGKGTPLLKSGIHSLGALDDADSDASSVAEVLKHH
uniref:Adipose-secreted signaling protein n=1 Tax=Plectus sambesii TaxID=2011161 RepID=A0A914WR28_9BILA